MPSSDRGGLGRDEGLDAFRGVTVLLMVLVNLQGNDEAAFPLLKHAPWHGLTLADLVFPWFILIVGMSLPFTIDRGRGGTLAAIALRSAILFGLGVLLGWFIRPTFDLEAVRWAGVLQRIALVYLVCALVAARWRGVGAVVIAAAACLLVHTAILLFVAAPGEPAPSLEMGRGISGWLDRALLPGRIHRTDWDPEGVLSTLPSIGTALLGLAIARWRLVGRRDGMLAAAGLAVTALGLALTAVVPLNKALWTASFALVASGTGVLLWMMLAKAVRSKVGLRLLSLPLFAGRTALTLYVLHMLLIAILVRKVGGETVWSATYRAFEQLGLPGGIASLAFAMTAAAISLAPVPWLRRRGLLIRA